jgi:hypothetical protein
MAKTRAQENRAIRQEALREQLSNQGHVQHVIDCLNKMDVPELPASEVNRLKVKAELHLKLVDKYLPGLKAMELTGPGGEEIEHRITFIPANDRD